MTLASHTAPQPPRTDFDRLAVALQQTNFRPIAGALTISPHRPLRSVDAIGDPPVELRAIAGELATSSSNPHVRGVALLLIGEASRSVEVLQDVTARTPSANVFADLAGALIAVADEDRSGEAAVDAYAAATHALQWNPQHPHATFNRMLALERLGLMGEAAREARMYLSSTPAAGWAVEARSIANASLVSTPRARWTTTLPRLQRAASAHDSREVERIVREFPQYARTWGEAVFLSDWADGEISKKHEAAAAALQVAQMVGDALAAVSGETLLMDACNAVRKANREQRTTLATAHRLYHAGRLAHRDHDHSRAENSLRRATEAFRAAGSPMSLVAQYYVGSSLYFQFRIPEASALLDALSRSLRKQHPTYRALQAQVGWERGVCSLVTGARSDALETLQQSAATFALLGERENAASLDALAAETLDVLDDPDAAWVQRTRALRELARTGNDSRALVAITAAANDRLRREQWARSLALYDIAFEIAQRAQHAELIPHILTRRSIAKAELGRRNASSDLASAEDWIQRLKDASARLRAEAELSAARARQPDVDPALSIRELDGAITYYAKRAPASLPSLLLERGRAHKRRGERAAARRDLLEGIRVLEQHRNAVRDLSERAMMFAISRPLFEEAIADALETNDVTAVFSLTERAHARAILDGMQLSVHAAATPPQLHDIRQRLARDAAIVVFVSSQNRMTAVVVRRQQVARIELDDATAISVQAAKLDAAMDGGEPEAAMAFATSLYEKIVQPLRTALDGVHVIAWVPDGILRGLPFGALYDRMRDRFVIEDFVVVEAPSAAVAMRAAEQCVVPTDGRTVVVGATSFDRQRFIELEPLPAASEEARAIATIRRNARVLIGPEAIPTAVIEELPRATIVHFAGHAVSGRTPGDAALVLASGDLQARSIAQLTLSATRLVVLTACRSATRGGRGDGPESLASAFLLAGVPTVVASAWQVEDEISSSFAKGFHRELLAQPDSATAVSNVLRVHARDAAHRPISPVRWASFAAIGGSTALIGER